MPIAGPTEGGAGDVRAKRRDKRRRKQRRLLRRRSDTIFRKGTSGGKVPVRGSRRRVRSREDDIAAMAQGRRRDLKRVDRQVKNKRRARSLSDYEKAKARTERDRSRNEKRSFRRQGSQQGEGHRGGVNRAPFRRARRSIRRQRGRVRRYAVATRRKDNSLNQLFQSLMGSVNAGAPNFDFEQVLNNNLKAINNAYDNERNAIRRGSRAAKKETRKNRKILSGVFNNLGKSYHRQANRQDREAKKDVKQVSQIFNQQGKRAENVMDRLQNEQVGMMKKLGIEDAGSDIIPGQTGILAKELSSIRRQKGSAARTERERGNIEERYLHREGQLARSEGASRAADQLDALQAFLFDQKTAKQDVSARRQVALAEAEAQLSAQFSKMRQEHSDTVWERLMDVAGFKLDVDEERNETMLARMGIRTDRDQLRLDRDEFELDVDKERFDRRDSQFDNLLELRKLANDRRESTLDRRQDRRENASDRRNELLGPLANVNNLFRQASPKASRKLNNVFNNLLNSPSVRANKFRGPGGKMTTMTPEQAAAMASQMGRRQGLNNTEMHLLRIAVLDYFG